MKRIVGKNIEICMSKWDLKSEGLLKFFPKIEHTPGKFSAWKKGKNLPPLEFILNMSDITGISVQKLCREIISLDEIPIQPIINKPYKQREFKLDQVNDPISNYLRIPEILRRLEELEDLVKKDDKLEEE